MLAFADRREAGRVLAESLGDYAGRQDVIVLALPRGGVPVGYEVARALPAPLDVFLVRKLGVPGNEELAMGAIASGGMQVLDLKLVDELQISRAELDHAVAREDRELERRQRLYRGRRPFPEIAGKTVLIVDDGLATGASMFAALRTLRKTQPLELVVAVPVAPPDTCEALRGFADRVVCPRTPVPFGGVGAWYQNFEQVRDDEVRALLKQPQVNDANYFSSPSPRLRNPFADRR